MVFYISLLSPTKGRVLKITILVQDTLRSGQNLSTTVNIYDVHSSLCHEMGVVKTFNASFLAKIEGQIFLPHLYLLSIIALLDSLKSLPLEPAKLAITFSCLESLLSGHGITCCLPKGTRFGERNRRVKCLLFPHSVMFVRESKATLDELPIVTWLD